MLQLGTPVHAPTAQLDISLSNSRNREIGCRLTAGLNEHAQCLTAMLSDVRQSAGSEQNDTADVRPSLLYGRSKPTARQHKQPAPAPADGKPLGNWSE